MFLMIFIVIKTTHLFKKLLLVYNTLCSTYCSPIKNLNFGSKFSRKTRIFLRESLCRIPWYAFPNLIKYIIRLAYYKKVLAIKNQKTIKNNYLNFYTDPFILREILL